MSLKSTFAAHKRTFIAGLGVAGAIALGLGATGAWFTASEPLPVTGNTGGLSVLVNGAPSNAAPLQFPNIVPGSANARTATFTVKNTGTVAADVSIGLPVTPSSVSGGTGLTASDIESQLYVGVDGYLPYESVGAAVSSASGTSLALGSLAPGQERTYTVHVGLADSAGNAWQNASASGTVTVGLTQSH